MAVELHGDDLNCKVFLMIVGTTACRFNAVTEIKIMPGIIKLSKSGESGVGLLESLLIIYCSSNNT
jgi:hypothetical protein